MPFLAFDDNGKQIGEFESFEGAAGACQDAAREANADEEALEGYRIEPAVVVHSVAPSTTVDSPGAVDADITVGATRGEVTLMADRGKLITWGESLDYWAEAVLHAHLARPFIIDKAVEAIQEAWDAPKTHWAILSRVVGSGAPWGAEGSGDTYDTEEQAEAAADGLRRREPTNSDGQALEYAVAAGLSYRKVECERARAQERRR